MAKTVMLEELAPDVQHALEDLLACKEPIIFARDGQPLGRMESYSTSNTEFAGLTPKEEVELRVAIAQEEADFTAGRYMTLEEFLVEYADDLQENEA